MNQFAKYSFSSSTIFKNQKSFVPFLEKRLNLYQGQQINNSRSGSNSEALNLYKITQEGKQILNKNKQNPFGIIIVLWESEQNNNQENLSQAHNQTKEYCRKMLLRTYQNNIFQKIQKQSENLSPFKKEKNVKNRSQKLNLSLITKQSQKVNLEEYQKLQFIQIYNSIELGKDENKRPINWFYIQADVSMILKDQNWCQILKIIFLISCSVLIKIDNNERNNKISILNRVFEQIQQDQLSKTNKSQISVIQNKNKNKMKELKMQLKKVQGQQQQYGFQCQFWQKSQKSAMLINTQTNKSLQQQNSSKISFYYSNDSNNSNDSNSRCKSLNHSIIQLQKNNQKTQYNHFNRLSKSNNKSQQIKQKSIHFSLSQDLHSSNFFSFSQNSQLPQLFILVNQNYNNQQNLKETILKKLQFSSKINFINIGLNQSNFPKISNKPSMSKNLNLGLRRTLSLQSTYYENLTQKNYLQQIQMQKIMINSKIILNKIKQKTNPFTQQSMTIQLLSKFIETFFFQLASLKLKTLSTKININCIWKTILQQEQKSAMDKCLNVYQQKFNDLTMKKSLISHQIFDQAHKRAKNASFQQLQKSFLNNNQFKKVLQRVIDQKQKNQKQIKSQHNYQWLKDLLRSQYHVIFRKIQLRQIKSLLSFKQELIIFKQFFKKKSQNCSSNTIRDYFQSFMLDKILQGVQIILQFQKQQLNKQILNIKKQCRDVINLLKEEKKKNEKQVDDQKIKLNDLNQQNKKIKQKQQFLYQKNKNMEIQVQQLICQKQKLSIQFQQKLNQSIKNHQKQIYSLNAKIKILENQLKNVESQVKKQKLLHKETKKYYQQLYNLNKIKKQFNTNLQLQTFKNNSQTIYSLRYIPSLTKIQSNQQDSIIMTIQKQKENELILKCEQMNKKKKEYDDKMNQLIKQNEMMIIRVKQLQNIDKKYQEQNIKNKEIMNQKFEIEIQMINLKSKIKRLELQINQQQQQYKKIIKQNTQLKFKKKELMEQISFLSIQKCKTDYCVQVEDYQNKKKMKQAIKVVQTLQKQYNKIALQLQKEKIRNKNRIVHNQLIQL